MMVHKASQDRTNFPPHAYLQLNSCGIGRSRGHAFTTHRPAGRVDYHIIYIDEGSMTAEYEGEMYILHAGDYIVYEPHQRQLYSFSEGENTISCWIHFTGTAADEVMRELGLSGGVRRAARDPMIRHSFDRLCGMEKTDSPSAAVQNGALLMYLGFLARSGQGEQTGVEALAPALRLMRREYDREIPVSECAAVCRMSESRFQHVFRETMGIPPHRYLLSIRMQTARDMLMHTDLRISEAAAQCGFTDSLYFSRIFRRECGMSPRQWREGHRP